MEEKKTPQEWEIGVKEQFAQLPDKELLDLAQHVSIQLAERLGAARRVVWNPESTPEDVRDKICEQIGRMAVMLDVLQLRYGDCAEEELAFLEDIESCLEDE